MNCGLLSDSSSCNAPFKKCERLIVTLFEYEGPCSFSLGTHSMRTKAADNWQLSGYPLIVGSYHVNFGINKMK